jgi:thiosulfate/3-mercaptopyruvate sulfurtransferase
MTDIDFELFGSAIDFIVSIICPKDQTMKLRILFLFTVSLITIGSISLVNAGDGKIVSSDDKVDLLVSTDWLNTHLKDKNLVIVDSTVVVKMDKKGGFENISGRAQYDSSHIPGAVFADLKEDLSGEGSLELLMPSPKQFAKAMGDLGINNDSHVVIYSADNHVWATRVWWMLRWAGHEKISVLDGGMAAWKAEGRPVSSEKVTPNKQDFKLNLNPKIISNRDEVYGAISDKNIHIVDALPIAHYQGKFSLYSRAGHIPTATNMSTSDLIDETGRFKSFDELDMIQEGDRSKRTITYCGGGVAASSAAFTLHRLGFTNVAVYMGSLQEWTLDLKNPMSSDLTKK